MTEQIPERISRLPELARNLWWSWHPEARHLFRALDYPLWRTSGHNPVKQLREISPTKLEIAARDPVFLAGYDAVMAAFDTDMAMVNRWFKNRYPDTLSGPVAYFSPEFAIHNSLPIYAGGLGILAGDICKEASDLGIPLVGVGFMYPQGYFHQHVSQDGWQEEIYQILNFNEAPLELVRDEQGRKLVVPVTLDSRQICVCVWQVRVGCTNLYLLDTNIEENAPELRQLTARLYIADREQRIQQEIVLGIGGTRVLRRLGIKPAIWQCNEGHTAFMMLERVREEIAAGASWAEATRKVAATDAFTTHTPVPAGHDVFPFELMDKYFYNYWKELGISRETFLNLGQEPGGSGFNMTVLALRLADYRNAVSRLHGKVARQMWAVLWPSRDPADVPITSITNGVHVPTWVAEEVLELYIKYVGRDWEEQLDSASFRERIMAIPDDELWAIRRALKRKLVGAIMQRARERWANDGISPQQVLTMGALLDPDALTIGFARRFAEYKRASLIFHDVEQLKKIVKDTWRPVQLVFAGKSHPADFPSKHLLHQTYMFGNDRAFQGRVAFIEDYDMHIARYLVQGVDVWLNTPRRLQEASGTSGMKAAVNGALNMSIMDGWWAEGYNGKNGWAINPDIPKLDAWEEDRLDSQAIYRLLEDSVVPLFYERDRTGVPHKWTQMVKESIGSIVPRFSARRMLKEYAEQIYIPAAQSIESRILK